MRGATYRGTVTEWRTSSSRLESRTELIAGEALQEQLTSDWSDIGVEFSSGVAAADWLLASQFYTPISRLNGSLLSAPFDSVEKVADPAVDDPRARFKAVREQGPSGRETWDVVIDLETMRPVTMTIVTGDNEWRQSAEFEFTYP